MAMTRKCLYPGLYLLLITMIPGIAGSSQEMPAEGAATGQDSAWASHLKIGEAVFTRACLSCHGGGVDGAPKLENPADWQERLKQDRDTLTSHAIQGHGRMPPKGGFFRLSNAEIAAAVDYVVDRSRSALDRLEKKPQGTGCNPVKNPYACSGKELEDIMTLHMLWLLGSPGD